MLTCKCLNIVINNLSTDIEKVDPISLNLTNLEKNEIFFQQDIGRIILDNITKEQSSLVCAETVGNWIVHQCWNCGLYTHAIQKDKGASNVLVNLQMLTNDNEIKALKQHENYSSVFRIIINQNNDIQLTNSGDISSAENLALVNLQQKLNEAIRLETQATEDRVRKYNEQQYNYLDSYRERARNEHRLLTRLILAKQSKISCERSANIGDFSTNSNRSECDSSLSHSQTIVKPKNNLVHNLTTKMKRDSSSRLASSSRLTNSVRNESYDSEILFHLDGMDDTLTSGSQHEFESDTDDSQGYEDHVPRHRTYSSNLAKSLPMNVPTFMSPYSRHGGDVDDDQAPEDPLDIAASIKALAKSVHGDAVFGDLPRPRFSSQI